MYTPHDTSFAIAAIFALLIAIIWAIHMIINLGMTTKKRRQIMEQIDDERNIVTQSEFAELKERVEKLEDKKKKKSMTKNGTNK